MNKKCPSNDNALSAQGHMRSHHKLHVSTDLIEGKHRIIPEWMTYCKKRTLLLWNERRQISDKHNTQIVKYMIIQNSQRDTFYSFAII